MEFVIRIYGAPYGFELYEGSEQELNYFQIFDNQSSEPVKMTVHRLNDHQISYNYLRYGYVTSGGRTGSFFGISVVFNNSYCSEFTKIYKLFNVVYDTIVEKAILFEKLTTGQVQARYKIGAFSEAEGEMTRIKVVLSQNIQDALASSIKPIEFSSSDFPNKELRLPDDVDNKNVSDAVNKYRIVSISPAYGTTDPKKGSKGGKVGEEVVRIPVEDLMSFLKDKNAILTEASGWSNKVNTFLINLRALQDNKQDVKSLAPRYESIMSELGEFATKVKELLNKIEAYHKIEPSNPYFKEEVQKEVTTAKDNVNTLLDSLRLYEKTIIGGGNGGGDPKPPSAFEKFIHENKKMLTMAGVVLCLIVGSVTAFNILRDKSPTDPSKLPEPLIDTTLIDKPIVRPAVLNVDSLALVDSGMSKYNNRKYTEAYKDFKSAENKDLMKACRVDYRNICMENAKRKTSKEEAITYFTNEMAKVEYTVTKQDQEEIRTSFSKKPAGSSGVYTIVLYQNDNNNNRQIVTGNIKQRKVVKLECKNGNEVVKASNWQVNNKTINPPEFTPQPSDETYTITCKVGDKTVNKVVKYEPQQKVSGGKM